MKRLVVLAVIVTFSGSIGNAGTAAESMTLGGGLLTFGMTEEEADRALLRVTVDKKGDHWNVREKRGDRWRSLGWMNFKSGRLCQMSRSWALDEEDPKAAVRALHSIFASATDWQPLMVRYRQWDAPDNGASELTLSLPGTSHEVWLNIHRMEGKEANLDMQEVLGDCWPAAPAIKKR